MMHDLMDEGSLLANDVQVVDGSEVSVSPNGDTLRDTGDGDDDGVVQRDEDERFSRYGDVIGQGRFKRVYKGFDEQDGLDIAWAIISGLEQHLDAETTKQLFTDAQRNVLLKHKNIIKCFKCWQEFEEIHLITELFNSGNLREYIQAHKQLGADALRKFSRQILEGIDYLHSQNPPIVHGDIRCDKIYVNGNEGTVKIGDLGLVTLLARRYEHSRPSNSAGALFPNTFAAVPESPDYDIFSFGLCMLEMYTQTVMDPEQPHEIGPLIALVKEESARAILELCLGMDGAARPTAASLLERFFQSNRNKVVPSRVPTPPPSEHAGPAGLPPSLADIDRRLTRESNHHEPAATTSNSSMSAGSDSGPASAPLPDVKPCELKGEDYEFSVRQSDRCNEGSLVHMQIKMSTVERKEDENGGTMPVFSRTIQYEHHMDEDTPESVGAELQDEYSLSDTDRDIVCAIIKEGLSYVLGERSQGT